VWGPHDVGCGGNAEVGPRVEPRVFMKGTVSTSSTITSIFFFFRNLNFAFNVMEIDNWNLVAVVRL
jgi:hypothetical protein